MMLRLARRLRTVDNENGLGLIEILVASLIGLLLMTAVGAAFVNTVKVTNFTVQNRSSTQTAANAMQEIIEVIHLATPIAVSGQVTNTPAVALGTRNSLVIYSLVDVTDPVNPAPSRVTFDIQGGNLVDTRCVGTLNNGFWIFTTCASTSKRTVAGTFVAPTGTQNYLFTYLDANGNVLPLTGSGTDCGSYPAPCLPAASLPLVGSIIGSVNLLAPGATNGPAYLQSKTGMPNVGIQKETS
jgi:Tfp pilus assembly protein PilW